MKEIIDKLSSYNIFNNLFPGIIFCSLSDLIAGYNLILNNVMYGVFVYYFIGLLVSRIGSIIIEPICKRLKIVKFSSYSDFINATKIDQKLEILSETNNTYRTIIAVFLCLLLLKAYNFIEIKYIFLIEYRWLIISIFVSTLFCVSYRKQTNYLCSRVEEILKKEK